MPTKRRSTYICAGILAAALLATGCGDDDDDGDAGSGDVGQVTDEEFGGHRLREIAADSAPSVDIDVQPDDHGGWNLHLMTEGFSFTPEQVGGPAAAGQGHAHVYVDDVKYSRVYAEWFYLPAEAVGEGEHTLMVTLNADDHTVWAVDGEPVSATTTLTPGEAGHDHDHDGDMSATPDAPDASGQGFHFTIADGEASPPLDRKSVDEGATVRIVVTSDQPDEIHLHGYDLSAAVGPGQDGVIEFTADQTGLFELETHESNLVLLQLQVQ